MLLQFTVGNFLSFREPVTFSMMASPEIDGIPEDLRFVDKGKNALSLAAIYGANAAGKSNLVEAMAFAKELIVTGVRPGDSTGAVPFSLNKKNIEEPSLFQFVFCKNKKLIRYGFECSDSAIEKEWLYIDNVKCFERNSDGSIVLGDIFNNDVEFYEFIVKGTRKEQLFVSELRTRNSEIFQDLNVWFHVSFIIISGDGAYPYSGWEFYRGESLILFVNAILRCADSGIYKIKIEEVEDAWIELNNRNKTNLVKNLKDMSENTRIPIVSDMSKGGLRKMYSIKDDKLIQVEFIFEHSEDQEISAFAIESESEGTQRLVDLLPSLMPSIDRTVLIDELDRRLHPNLSRLLIEIWRKMNRQGSQLIFTTHDDNLLADDLLRRDEVWLVDKDETGHSSLTSLAEFKIPEGTNIERQYLRGRFGGVPYLRREELDAFLEEIQSEGANLT